MQDKRPTIMLTLSMPLVLPEDGDPAALGELLSGAVGALLAEGLGVYCPAMRVKCEEIGGENGREGSADLRKVMLTALDTLPDLAPMKALVNTPLAERMETGKTVTKFGKAKAESFGVYL